MTRSVVPFRAWHLWKLEEAGQPAGGYIKLSKEQGYELERHPSWTAMRGDDVLACGGTIEMWAGRHLGWAYLRPGCKDMLFVTRAANKVLDNVKGRIEMSVQRDFRNGHRWAHMLGFCIETMDMLRYGPDGATHTGYVRFN